MLFADEIAPIRGKQAIGTGSKYEITPVASDRG